MSPAKYRGFTGKKHILIKQNGVFVFACDKTKEFHPWFDRWAVGGRTTCNVCKKIKKQRIAQGERGVNNHIEEGGWYEPLA